MNIDTESFGDSYRDGELETKYFICSQCCEVFCCSIESAEKDAVQNNARVTGKSEAVPETLSEPYTYYCATCGNPLKEM